jgi:hypothetical protein
MFANFFRVLANWVVPRLVRVKFAEYGLQFLAIHWPIVTGRSFVSFELFLKERYHT